MNMCTVQSIKDAIWENCQSQYDMESTDIDRVLQTPRFLRNRDHFLSQKRKGRCIGSTQENMKKCNCHNSFYRIVAFFMP